MDVIQELLIREFLDSAPGKKLQKIIEDLASVQKHILSLMEKDDDEKLKLLKIGTVFTLFLIDTLASKGKRRAAELDKDDWKGIAEKVSQYAILNSEQGYSEFVFDLYADYIDLSVETIKATAVKYGFPVDKIALDAICAIAAELREKKAQLHRQRINESRYVEDCLWLSLEAMVKLLSTYFTLRLPKEYAQLVQAISQLGFEYGRYVLYAREQALLEEYIQHQYVLDGELQARFEAYMRDVEENAKRFDLLISKAFSPDIHEALVESAELARSFGVPEEEILTSIEDIDSFFLD